MKMPAVLALLGLLALPRHAASTPSAEAVQDAMVKIYAVANSPDYFNPWAMKGPRQGTGSGCILSGRRILTNGHVVGNQTFLQVRRNGRPQRYQARVLSVCHEADLALLTVDDPAFFEGATELELGELPPLETEVVVFGFPLGGDALSTTRGVLSRVEHQVYAHSSVVLLAGQIDAAINPGNSGGPVIVDGRIVGVAMQNARGSENIGYMIPTPIVRHFFQDIEDGRVDGFPGLGLILQNMESPDMRAYCGMGPDRTGMLVTHVAPPSSGAGVLEEGDVLLAVGGRPIANDGTVSFRGRERTRLAYVIQGAQVGDDLEVRFLRGGEEREAVVKLDRPMQRDWLIPMEQYETRPSYFIYGGIVFSPVTKNFLEQFGNNWASAAPRELTVLLGNNVAETDGQQVVVALRTLPASVNEGYHGVYAWIVETVDGQPFNDLAELVRRVEREDERTHVVFGNGRGQRIILDRAKAAASAARVLATYRIVSDRSADLPGPAGRPVSPP